MGTHNGHNVPFLESVSLKKRKRKAVKSVSEALFRLCRGTNIITLLGCDRISGHVPRLFISFFSVFVDSYFAGAREAQEDTIGFY